MKSKARKMRDLDVMLGYNEASITFVLYFLQKLKTCCQWGTSFSFLFFCLWKAYVVGECCGSFLLLVLCVGVH